MKSRAKNTMKRVLSWTLIVTLMLTFMPLIEYPLNAAGITNPTVEQAVLDKYPGVVPVDVKIIDISNNPNVIGTLDLAQIVTEYPNVAMINISNTNITDIINPVTYTGTIMCNGTFVNHSSNTSPRKLATISKSNTITYNLETQIGGIDLINLINDIKVSTGDSPLDLIKSLKSVTIDGTPITLNTVGTSIYGGINHTDLQSLSAGIYPLVLEFEFKNVESTWTYKMEYELEIKDVSLKAEPDDITVPQGGKVSFTLSKFDNEGDPIPVDATSLSFTSSTLSNATITTFSATKTGRSASITGRIALTEATGLYTLTVTDNISGKSVDVAIEVKPALSSSISLELWEQNDGNTSIAPLASTSTVYIKGGTAISSETLNKITAGTYTESTVYLLYDGSTPLGSEYIDVLEFVDSSGNNIVGEFIPVGNQAALRITAGPTDSTISGNNFVISMPGATLATIPYQIVAGLAQSYKVFMIDSDEYSSPNNLQDLINNEINDPTNDPYIEEVGEFRKSGSSWLAVDGKNTATMLEGKEAYFVVAAQYGTDGPYYVASASSVTSWYENVQPNTMFDGIFVPFTKNADIQAMANTIISGVISTKVLDVNPMVGSGDKAIVEVAVQISVGSTITNTLVFSIDVTPREISHYEFRKNMNGDLLTAVDYNIPIGASKDFTIFAVYDNGDSEIVDFSKTELTVVYSNNTNQSTVLFPSGKNPSNLNNGTVVTFEATDDGRSNDAIAGSEVTITVTDKDGETGSMKLKLGYSLINGVTYYVETPEGIYDYNAPSSELKNTLSKADHLLPINGNGILEIPRGLEARVWIVPTFTNRTMYNKDLVSDWSLYAINNLTGITNPLGAPSTPIGTNYYIISASGDLPVNIGDDQIYRFPISNSPAVNGISHNLIPNTLSVETELKVKITDPIVTEIIPQVWDETLNSGAGDYRTLTPITGGYEVAGNVGEELKLRLKVIYSDGESVDILGSSAPTYKNGTYFIPLDDVNSYVPTVGYTKTPADLTPPLADFGLGTDDEMSVIYGRFMSRTPGSYAPMVNPAVASPPAVGDWNNGNTPMGIHDELVKLTEEIKINNISQTNPLGIKTGYLEKGGIIVPGHYSIKLLETGTYEVDFSGIYQANGFDKLITIDDSTIKITVGLPTIEKVYLVSDDLVYVDDSDLTTDLYEFERSSLNIENGYNVFYVYPMFLDSSYYNSDEYLNKLIPTLPDYLIDPNTTTKGIRKVLATDWASGSIGTWTSSDTSKLLIEPITVDGYLCLKVTVLEINDIQAIAPVKISLALNLVWTTTSPVPAAKYDLTQTPADPTDMAIYTTSQSIVQDIEIGAGYTATSTSGQVVTEIELGQAIYFPVKYRMTDIPAPRILKANEYPSQVTNITNPPVITNILVLGEHALPGQYDVAVDNITGDFKFTPYALGTYTFKLSTTNIDNGPIPTQNQGDRTITFKVVAPTISQNVYYGEIGTLNNLPSGWKSIIENGSSLLDQTALDNGQLKMIDNLNDTTVVEVRDANGNLLATYNLTLIACTVKYKLIPESSPSSWFKFAPGESVGAMWEITYVKPDFTISFVDHAPVTSITPDGSSPHNFLALSDGKLTATADGTDDPQYGIYTATEPRPGGNEHTLYAILDLNGTERTYGYELHDSNTSFHNVITSLSLTVGDKQKVYVYDTVNGVYINEFTLDDGNTTVVNATHKGGYAEIEATAGGSTATITFTPILGGASLTLSVTVDALPIVKYQITGTVTKAGTTPPEILSGAAVELFDSTNNSKGTTTTNSSGQYSFTNLDAGTYKVKVTLTGYNDGEKNGNITSSNITVDIALVPISQPVYTIEGQITDSATSAGIAGATVKLYDPSDLTTAIKTATADGSGNYTLTNVVNGNYTVEASFTGYTSNSTTTTVNNGNEPNVNIVLTLTPPVTYTISGTITDATTGAGISGAAVELFNSSNASGGTTTTDGSGNYTFNSVVDDTYTVEASASGYTSGNTTTTVNGNNVTNINIALVPVGVYSYRIEGQITDSSTGAGIAGATVKLYNSANANIRTVNADTNGNYTFNTVVNGTYTVEASYTGYTTDNTIATVADGDETNVNIALDPTEPTPGTYTISGKIKGTSGLGIAGATVILTDGTTTRTTKTNLLGKYSFNNIPNGSYVVEASAVGYTSNSGNVDVYNDNATLDITLQSSIEIPDLDLCSAFIVLSQNLIKVGEHAIATINTLNFGDTLTYIWTNSNNSIATLLGTGNSVKLTGVKPGTTTITCTVSDGTNTVVATIELKVNANISNIGNMVVLPVIVPGLGTYTVTYDSQGGSDVNKLTNVTTGAKITAPVEPKRDGYTFDGWYKEATCLNAWDFNTDTVTKDTTLYAKWTKNEVEAKPEVVKEPEKEVEKVEEKPVSEPAKPIVTETHSAYISGYGNNKFGPDDSITRAEATQIFFNLLSDSDKASTATKSFTDVDSGAWYYKAVSVMAGLGIATGVTEDKFDPETPITREDFTAMAVRFADLAPLSGATGFSDVSESDSTAGYIKAAVNAGYILGYSDKTFKPKNEITRAEAVTIVNRVLVRVPDKGYINASLSKLTTFEDVTTAHWGYYEILEAANTHKYIKEDSKTEEWMD